MELDGVYDEFDGGFWRVDELVLCVELFEDIVLECAAEGVPSDVALFGHGEVHGPDDAGGAVDGLGDGDGVDGDVFVESVHVFDGVDCDAALADFADGEHVVGVASHECWEVEGGGEACVCLGGCFSGFEEVLKSFVGVVCGAEPGELAHGPESGEVAVGEEASCEGELAGIVDVAVEVLEGDGEILWGVAWVEDDSRDGDGVWIDVVEAVLIKTWAGDVVVGCVRHFDGSNGRFTACWNDMSGAWVGLGWGLVLFA